MIPFEEGAETLSIVSGYAGHTIAYSHFQQIKKAAPRRSRSFQIELLVGMCLEDGLPESTHQGFLDLCTGPYKDQFTCRYVVSGKPVHTKLYLWMSRGLPSKAFTGSANYSQRAFSPERREMMAPCDPKDAKEYFDLIKSDTLDCRDPKIPSLINLHNKPADDTIPSILAGGAANPIQISLLDHNGRLPQRSGLNWGQRPEQNREPNQAYIRVPMPVARTDFFPEIGKYFTVLTDDGETLVCVRAQQHGKGIHTPQDNSILGMYFRKRLGVPAGKAVTENDLAKYGRNSLDFFPIDDETYWMDFSN